MSNTTTSKQAVGGANDGGGTKRDLLIKTATDAILLSSAFSIRQDENPNRELIETVIGQIIDSATAFIDSATAELCKQLADREATIAEKESKVQWAFVKLIEMAGRLTKYEPSSQICDQVYEMEKEYKNLPSQLAEKDARIEDLVKQEEGK